MPSKVLYQLREERNGVGIIFAQNICYLYARGWILEEKRYCIVASSKYHLNRDFEYVLFVKYIGAEVLNWFPLWIENRFLKMGQDEVLGAVMMIRQKYSQSFCLLVNGLIG